MYRHVDRATSDVQAHEPLYADVQAATLMSLSALSTSLQSFPASQPTACPTTMPIFWDVTAADLIDLDLKDLPVDQLSSLVTILAKKLAKVEKDYAHLDIEYTQTCEELDELQIACDAEGNSTDDDDEKAETDVLLIPKEMAQLLIEAQCTQSPAKRVKMMKHLPNMLAFDPNALSRFPSHLRKVWARKKLAAQEDGELGGVQRDLHGYRQEDKELTRRPRGADERPRRPPCDGCMAPSDAFPARCECELSTTNKGDVNKWGAPGSYSNNEQTGQRKRTAERSHRRPPEVASGRALQNAHGDFRGNFDRDMLWLFTGPK